MKTTLTLQKVILARIKTQGVKPMPKGYFKMREYILWGLLGVFVAALSVGFAMIIFMLKGTDMSLFNKLGLSITEKVLYSIPFFWIVASVVVATVAFINFRNTRRGYRTSTRQFALISVLISVGLGSVAYAFNVSEFVDRTASANIPLYNDVVPLNTNSWLDPAHGLLSGTVRSKDSNSSFYLRDAESVLWHVTGDIELPSDFTFSSGDRIRLIGKAGDGDTFEATEIVPWE
jgi:hypothetical protein